MKRHIKRLLDVIFAVILLIMFAPLIIVIWSAIIITMGSPAVFRQRRPGKNGCVFEILKFRTMTDACDRSGHLLPDRERVTPLGVFLRISSLDELPQVINVLKGEMSFVGPRPLLAHYIVNCRPEYLRRYDVCPGITGWAQIKGRRALEYTKRFDYDIWYVDNWSLSLDIKIMFRTIGKILRREGVEEICEQITDANLHPLYEHDVYDRYNKHIAISLEMTTAADAGKRQQKSQWANAFGVGFYYSFLQIILWCLVMYVID